MTNKPTYEELQQRILELENERTFRLVVENSHAGIAILNHKGVYEYVNDLYCSITGRSRGDLIGRVIGFQLDRKRKDFLRDRRRRRQSGEDVPERYEFDLERPNGEARRVEILSTVIPDREGRPKTIAQVLDITDVHQAQHELRRSEAEYRDLYQNAPIGLYRATLSGRLLSFNDVYMRLFGYSDRAELQQKHLSELYADPTERAIFLEAIQRNRKVEDYELRLRKRNGEIFWGLLNVSMTEKGPVNGPCLNGFIHDITETKRLRTQLAQSQKMEAIGTLAGGIAHDFNNILGAIMGYAQLVELYSGDPAKVDKYVGRLNVASERAKKLVHQILTFSRQNEAERIPIDLAEVVSEALHLMRASLPATIDIRQRVPAASGTVLGDQTQIHQVIMNLCTNAFHAMQQEGGVLGVELEPLELHTGVATADNDLLPGPYLQLTVSDTGCGMDRETLSRIFDPYFTTKELGSGTGLGLASVHGIVKRHGGGFLVESEPHTGTVFRVLFPASDTRPAASSIERNVLARGNESILFVDDEKFMVDIGKKTLESLGYRVATRTSPYDAIEAFRASPRKYQLVITDMTMPGMTGDRLAVELRRIDPTIPVILCSGFGHVPSIEDRENPAIRAIVRKPFTLQEMSRAIRKELDKSSPDADNNDHHP